MVYEKKEINFQILDNLNCKIIEEIQNDKYTRNWNENAIKRMKAALGLLDDRSRRILEERWLNENKMTLHELAAEYQVSAERIRQLEANAIKKLSNTMAL